MTVKHRRPLEIHQFVYYAFLVITAVIMLVPVVWMASASFDRVNSYALPFPPHFIPHNPSLFNYEMVIVNMKIFMYIKNTVLVALYSQALLMLIIPMAGFAFSKGSFPLKSLLLLCIMSSMMVPFETKITPIYMLCRSLGLTNTLTGVVIPGVLTSSLYIFLCKKFFDDLPNELMESAGMDGASRLRVYLQIYLPLIGPAIATMSVLNVMGVWNDLLWPMIVINKQELFTIQVGLAMTTSSGSDAISKHAGMSTAAAMLSIIPLALVFIFLQRYIVQSVAVSGIKQ